MKVRYAVTAALLATLAATSTASAQAGVYSAGGSWQSGWTPGTKVNEFWNNRSDDGAHCNIGFFVTAGYGPCINQHPAVMPSPFGWTNATYLAQSVPSGSTGIVLKFRPGTYTLNFLGRVAGATPMRYIGVTSTDGSGLLTHAFGTLPETYTLTADRDWQFYMQSYLPVNNIFKSSTSNTQFVVFANSAGGNGNFAGEWLVGGEDNACAAVGPGCGRKSDYDFNDGLVHIQTDYGIRTVVPEPSTYAMLGIGLLAVGGTARRRRRSAAKIA